MQPKLLQTERALYIVEDWDGENRSGMFPYSDLVLIRTDECAPVTAGGIYLDDENRERMTMASETGILIAVGSEAFKYTHDGRPWPADAPKPKVGDRVWFQRYSGSLHRGFDGKTYRSMNGSAIGMGYDSKHAPYIQLPEGALAAFTPPTVAEEAERITPQWSGIPGAENVVDVAGGPIVNLNEES